MSLLRAVTLKPLRDGAAVSSRLHPSAGGRRACQDRRSVRGEVKCTPLVIFDRLMSLNRSLLMVSWPLMPEMESLRGRLPFGHCRSRC